jgi:hypothetical protein
MNPRWGVSPLDRSAHAIDVDADHPLGAYVARCGHHLMIITTLCDEPVPGLRPVGGPVSLLARGGRTGRHRRGSDVLRTSRHRRYVPLVDARTLTEHLLTDDAVAAGRLPAGRYVALCGLVILPASLTVGERDRCRECMAVAR